MFGKIFSDDSEIATNQKIGLHTLSQTGWGTCTLAAANLVVVYNHDSRHGTLSPPLKAYLHLYPLPRLILLHLGT